MMSQFTAGKNPPWARPADLFNVSAPGGLGGPSIGQPQVPGAQMMAHQQGLGGPAQTVYSVANSAPGITQAQFATAQQMAAVALQHAQGQMPHGNTVLPQPGIAMPTSLSTSNVQPVSYPNLRPNAQQTQGPPPKQRVFTGTVTKLHENFGFVDEDVFFQKSCVKGAMPKVRERVLVEATYNPTMPFKWNATRIQLLPNQAGMGGIKGSSNTSIPPPLGLAGLMGPGSLATIGGLGTQASVQELQQSQMLAQASQAVSGLRGNIGGRRGDQMRYDRDKDRDRDRDRDRRDRIRQVRKRSRTPPPRRSSPPARPRSPVYRRPARLAPRYVVQIPKISFDMKEANVVTVKTRYPNMYIPSDFFNTKFSWTEAFPHARSFQLGQNCCFHVMHKDVVPLSGLSTASEPADADHKFSAKVMLLSCPGLTDLYHASCSLSEDPSDVRDSFQHPTRLLSFLVGLRGKGEPMAVGGPWSPSLDGANPEEDPRVLINTAIRTTRHLTNIDLSGCTKWYRFAEIRYLRPEETHKGRVVPARVETVVIFLPDVWSCSPTQLEWEGLQTAYKKHSKQTAEPVVAEAATQALLVEEDMEVVEDSEQNEPTHFSELEPRSMKLVELRRELESRSLSPKGLRSQLIARLTKAMKSEQEQEKQEKEEEESKNAEADQQVQDEIDKDESSKAEESKDTGKETLTKALYEGWVDDEDKKRKEDRDKDRDKALLERRYTLPDTPSIIVHPSPSAKGGKFDCTIMSLSVLLDYRPEDNKEHSFEVSLFAELFNEMLMRDLGYCIYKALVLAPEKKEEDIKKEKDSKDKKKGESHEKDSSSKDLKEPSVKKAKLDDNDSKKDKEGDKKDKESERKEKEAEKKEKESDNKKEKEADSKKEKEKPKETKDDKVKSKAGKEGQGAESAATGNGGGEKDEEEGDGGMEGEDAEEEGTDEEVEKEEEAEDKKPDVKKLRASWDRPRKRPKRVTVDPHLLLAFVYFDQNHTGHLLDKDLEEILHTTGLQLSRAQVRKLVQKVLVRDAVHYRKLTDRDADKVIPESKVTSNGLVSIGHSGCSPTGNLGLLQGHKPKVDESDPKPAAETKPTPDKQQSGMVSYRGAMLDIKSLLQQLEKSEKNRAQMEARCQTATKEISDLKSKCSKSEEKKDKVESELTKLQAELDSKTAESLLLRVQNDNLQDVLGKAKTMFKALEEEIEKAEAPVNVATVKKEK